MGDKPQSQILADMLESILTPKDITDGAMAIFFLLVETMVDAMPEEQFVPFLEQFKARILRALEEGEL